MLNMKEKLTEIREALLAGGSIEHAANALREMIDGLEEPESDQKQAEKEPKVEKLARKKTRG